MQAMIEIVIATEGVQQENVICYVSIICIYDHYSVFKHACVTFNLETRTILGEKGASFGMGLLAWFVVTFSWT